MEYKKNKKIALIIIIIFLLVFFGIIFFKEIQPRYFAIKYDYILIDDNTSEEKVEKYINDYLYNKYKKNFKVEFENKELKSFCDPEYGCVGVGKVDDIYDYYYIASDENELVFPIIYSNGFKINKKEVSSAVYEEYDVLFKNYKRVSELYQYYKVINDNKNERVIYVYDKLLDLEKIDKIVEYIEYDKLIISNDSKMLDIINSLKSYYSEDETGRIYKLSGYEELISKEEHEDHDHEVAIDSIKEFKEVRTFNDKYLINISSDDCKIYIKK